MSYQDVLSWHPWSAICRAMESRLSWLPSIPLLPVSLLSESQRRTGDGGRSSQKDLTDGEMEGELVRETNGKSVTLSRPAAAHKSKMGKLYVLEY